MPPPEKASLLSSTLDAISSRFKPHRAEAIQRIRTNALSLLVLLVLSYLLPLPSLPTALRVVVTWRSHQRWSSQWVYGWICMSEVALMTIFTLNVLEGVYAIKYPRQPLPPIASPKVKGIRSAPATPQRPFKLLSPNTSPQPQKPFSHSPSASFSMSSSTYIQSPASTPSRVLQYSLPPTLSTNTNVSSTSGYLTSPSPMVSAYRGKHGNSGVGRALDGSYLGRVTVDGSNDDL